MRRKDREILDTDLIYAVMERCDCCRLGFYDEGEVYIVPLNFGFQRRGEQTVLYFHGAAAGRKYALAQRGGKVGFEMDCGYRLTRGESACEHAASFESIIGQGTISVLTDEAERRAGLQCIMAHYTQRGDWSFRAEMMGALAVFKLEVTALSCKIHE